MSTAKFHVDDDENSGRDIKGPRPSPLKINKASHFIHKSSSSSSTSMSSVLSDSAAPARPQQRRPVIIYTHSPKIIHTQARDFMALVQKLTGVSRPNDDEPTAQPDHHHQPHKSDIKSLSLEGGNDRNVKPVSHDDNDSSSALTDENCGGGGKGSSSSFLSPNLNLNQNQNQTNQYFADIPLFTPNSGSFYCSPRPVYRYPDSSYASPNVGNSMSPSVFEFLKGLPEY